MVAALRRFGRRSLIVRLGYGAFAFACASMLAGCDLLLTMLPQGGANAAFAYADPRLEKSVRIKGLNEVFNLAVAPDGRVFAIARDGVAEYTADLKHVRTYYPDAAEGIQRRDDGDSPEEWQVASGPGGAPVLFGTKSGVVLFLFEAGGTIYQRKLYDFSYYAAIQATVDFDPVAFYPYQETTLLGFDPLIRVLGVDFSVPALFSVREQTVEDLPNGLRNYGATLDLITPWFSPPASLSFESDLTVPKVRSDYSVHRLYPRAGIVALVMGYNSYIGEVESSTFIYDRALGGEPIARFDMRGAITAASDTALYAVTSDHDESGGWIHKLRFRP